MCQKCNKKRCCCPPVIVKQGPPGKPGKNGKDSTVPGPPGPPGANGTVAAFFVSRGPSNFVESTPEYISFTVTSSGDYILQLELKYNVTVNPSTMSTFLEKNGTLQNANVNCNHRRVNGAPGTENTYTHTAKITAVVGDVLRFRMQSTCFFDNGSITILKIS